MKLDMHVHSSYSRDGTATPEEILKRCRAAGLDGLSITDHNEIAGTLRAFDSARSHGLLVVRGLEVSTSEGHVLAYGIREFIPRGLSVEATIDRIRDGGGIPVAAHPLRFGSGIGLEAAVGQKFGAIETLNGGNSRRSNARAKRLAERVGRPQSGGSDAHRLTEVGRAYTLFESAGTEDDLLQQMAKGLGSPGGNSRRQAESVMYACETLFEWVRRGFRRL